MKNIVYLILILFSFTAAASKSTEQKMDQAFGEHIQYKEFFFTLKKAVLNNQAQDVANLVNFPVSIFDGKSKFVIQNKMDFLLYYPAIFEQSMLTTIEQQSFDGLYVNWQGVMIGNGEIWYSGICEDKDCTNVNVKISSFYNANFFNSEIVRNASAELLKNGTSKLHESLHLFIEPVFQWKTKNFIIRVDKTAEGEFRYAAWSSDSDQQKQPNIIVNKGKIIFDGSGGNHYYEFKNGNYTYRCFVTVIGNDNSPSGTIEIFEDNERVLYQPVIRVLTQS